MSEPEDPADAGWIEVGRIEIVRTLSPDGDLIDSVRAVNGQDDEMPLTEALGMLRLADDTLIRMRMAGGKDDE